MYKIEKQSIPNVMNYYMKSMLRHFGFNKPSLGF